MFSDNILVSTKAPERTPLIYTLTKYVIINDVTESAGTKLD